MKLVSLAIAALIAAPAMANLDVPPTPVVMPDLSAYVKKVGNATPDATGNVNLPNTFTGTSCTNCTMADPAFTGSLTVNGAAVASTTGVNNAVTAATAGLVKSINAVAPDASGNVALPTTTFIAGFTQASPGTYANLLANAPCNATRSNQFATITDLYGSVTETMRCTNFGAWGYQWRAQRADYATTQTVSGGTVTVSCNVTAPVLRLQGTLTSALNVAFSTANCTPGQRQEVQIDLTLGIFSATATSLVGTATTKLLGAAGTSLYVFDTVGWRAY